MLKKSVVIAGRHETSISIEEEFYCQLVSISKEKNMSINQLVTFIDGEKDESKNLSSAVRIYVLNYVMSNK